MPSNTVCQLLDTGIDLEHPDLNVDINNSASFIANESSDVVGVAARATVVAVKVYNNLPDIDPNSGCPVSSIINGVDFVSIKAQPGDFINMSLGGGRYS